MSRISCVRRLSAINRLVEWRRGLPVMSMPMRVLSTQAQDLMMYADGFKVDEPSEKGRKQLPPTVPYAEDAGRAQVEQLTEFIRSKKKLVVLTGAGVSTESNIPDYRSPGVGLYMRSNHRPTLHHEFVGDPELRQRYWARNFVAWTDFKDSKINTTHQFLSWLENQGLLHYLVTQNVDGLHTAAGNVRSVELHGCTQRVECLGCGKRYSRRTLQPLMAKENPGWVNFDQNDIEDSNPDGDVSLLNVDYSTFQSPECTNAHCYDNTGAPGLLKPDLVFFGGNVPKERVDFTYARIEEADGLLILGSSMKVYSGWRFAKHAAEKGIPVAIVNIGETRADDIATLKIEARLGDIIGQVWHRLARKRNLREYVSDR